MIIYYEKKDEIGTYFENEEGTVYREGETPFARFQAMLDKGDASIKPYTGSPLEVRDKSAEKSRKEREERAWRNMELQKSDLELLKLLEAQFPDLAAKREALRQYPQSPDFMKKRPK